MTEQPEDPRAPRRHPAQVTADRLIDHTAEYSDMLTVREIDAISRTVRALLQVAEGNR